MSVKEHRLVLPLKEEDVRQLRMGDILYVSGLVHTLRDMGHRRAVELCHQNRISEIPFQTLNEGILWHCGPIARYNEEEKKWVVKSAGSTTSSRFSPLGAKLIEYFRIRLIIGKGTMTESAHIAMKNFGACFLNSTGGCAVMYAEQIEQVENVFWEDLGQPEACWVLKVNNLGPLIVGIDSFGSSLFDKIGGVMRSNLQQTYSALGLKKEYAYLPKRVPSGVIEG